MPIQITNTNFTDFSGNTLPFYKSNAGDKITLDLEIRSIIRITSLNNPMTLDPTLSQVTSSTISWIEEGFRVNDWCKVYIRDQFGGIIQEWFTQISYVDDTIADFGLWLGMYNIANNEILEVYALDYYNQPSPPPAGFVEPRRRADLDLLINHSLSTAQGNQFSLIDGEVSRFVINGLEALAVGGSITAYASGKQSGQFIEDVSIVRNPNNSDNWAVHILTIQFINSGVYNESWFDFASCLKLYIKGMQASISGEPYDRTEFIYDQDANTGFFNEANNTSQFDSTLIQATNVVDYCKATTHNVIIETTDVNIGLGACYISTDDNYYRNKIQNQLEFTMILSTDQIAVGTRISPNNPSNANYSIEIVNITNPAPNQTEIEFIFTPNANFDTFMSNVDDGDRLFYIWIKAGNINHLVFAGQLTCDPPEGGALIMKQSYAFLDHCENVTDIIGNATNFQADTEDDIAYYGTFGLDYFGNYQSFQVRIEAKNIVTEDRFTLQESNFSFDSVQVSNSGQLLLNEVSNVVSTLPNTSVKNNALLRLEPNADGLTDYGVSIYYPFLLNWKYWLDQTNANVDFYPTQNKNWEQYDNLANWILQIKLTLVQNNLSFIYEEQFIDNKYDNSPDLLSEIELYRDSDNQLVSIIPEGDLMRIESTHTKLTGNFDQLKTWGMITIEPKESTPRYILSSVVPYDNNTNNPLYPISGNLVNISYPSSNVAKMICYFDPDRINLTNGVKITAKIKEGCKNAQILNKLTTDDQEKLTTDNNNKILS